METWGTQVLPHTVTTTMPAYRVGPYTLTVAPMPAQAPMKKPLSPSLPFVHSPDGQRGSAAVEFALLLPVLLLVVFGVIEMSLALYNKTVITQASREAARAGIVLVTPRATDADINKHVTEHAQAVLVQLGAPGKLTTVVDRSNPAQLKVTVQYRYAGVLLGRLMGRSDNNWALSASTVMVYE